MAIHPQWIYILGIRCAIKASEMNSQASWLNEKQACLRYASPAEKSDSEALVTAGVGPTRVLAFDMCTDRDGVDGEQNYLVTLELEEASLDARELDLVHLVVRRGAEYRINDCRATWQLLSSSRRPSCEVGNCEPRVKLARNPKSGRRVIIASPPGISQSTFGCATLPAGLVVVELEVDSTVSNRADGEVPDPLLACLPFQNKETDLLAWRLVGCPVGISNTPGQCVCTIAVFHAAASCGVGMGAGWRCSEGLVELRDLPGLGPMTATRRFACPPTCTMSQLVDFWVPGNGSQIIVAWPMNSHVGSENEQNSIVFPRSGREYFREKTLQLWSGSLVDPPATFTLVACRHRDDTRRRNR
ncbi:unnamed protein product [Protopolystoma xenopodis]|uniref:Uncharacterized protein n=1 Tax=Protopolystoma xenopodis TaxID=117903 RepID=A0A448WEN6_9PLAT|nr:unnamed protein product [Protopolystoma xenopodis]